MTTRKIARHCKIPGALLIGALTLSSCGTGSTAEPYDGVASTDSFTTSDTDVDHGNMLVAEVDDPVSFEQCVEAEQIDGATVEWLDDVILEEQRIEGLEAETITYDHEQVELPGVPELVVPEIVAQAGCIIEYPAPGGCLPAVEISGSYIPGYRLPERVLPAVELPDGKVLEEKVQPAIESKAVEIEGKYQEEVCQSKPQDAADEDVVGFVVRPFIVRPFISTSFSSVPSIVRSGSDNHNGDSIPTQSVAGYSVPSVSIGSASVNSDMLESYVVEGSGHTEYAEDNQLTAYTTEGDVLFNSDDHALLPDAEIELQAIANDIAQRYGEYTVTVEGHTDNFPSQEYADNTELSEQRAQSVVVWLQQNTDIEDEDITAKGMGDEYPRAKNDSDEGRQQNRRVVITVKPVNYESEIDYEVEE